MGEVISRVWETLRGVLSGKPDEVDRCGVYGLSTDETDPFHEQCVRHDQEFTAHSSGDSDKTRFEVDRDFLSGMVEESSGYGEALRAVLYFVLAAGIGGLVW